jgi:Tannase and feruloyl esterase
MRLSLLCSVLTVFVAGSVLAVADDGCVKLQQLKLPATTLTSVTSVADGPFALPPGSLAPSVPVPAFCRVQAEIQPTADSHIKIEVWMPALGWNGKFEQIGNGGLAGSINLFLMAQVLNQGFAAAATDDGHEAAPTDGSWAIGHPEKVKDFGYRAVHETNVSAKKIIAAFYQKSPRYSYFNGCSEGGREAMMEAQRFPGDFNGILAGAAAHYWTQLMAAFAWNAQAMSAPGAFIPEAKRRTVENAALAACGSQHGVTDKFIKYPLQCSFDPSTLLCKTGDSDNCLTSPQVEALKKIYSGPKTSHGEQISPGYEPGAEAEAGPPGISFSSYIFGPAPGASLDAMFSSSFYGSFVFEKPGWKVNELNFDKDIAVTEQKVGQILNASDPDLSGLEKYGTKLIQYHGWNDGSPPPRHATEYYDRVAQKIGGYGAVNKFYRLFMAPGMMHCGGGAGPNLFGNMLDFAPAHDADHNIFLALQRWVEDGVAPDSIIATKRNDDPTKGVELSRPLCPYPQEAEWTGKGNSSEAVNWKCQTIKR